MTDGARFALTTSVIGANFAYPRRVAFTRSMSRSMTKRFSTSHTPSRSGPRPAFIAPITVASWLELPIPQLWRPAGDVVLDCAEHLDVDLRTSTPQAMSQRPAEHRFEAHDARRGDVAGEGSVRAVDETDGPRDEEQQY
jgi:hypothetical protein